MIFARVRADAEGFVPLDSASGGKMAAKANRDFQGEFAQDLGKASGW